MTCFARTLRTLRAQPPSPAHRLGSTNPSRSPHAQRVREHNVGTQGWTTDRREARCRAQAKLRWTTAVPAVHQAGDRGSTDTMQNGSAESADPSGFKIESDSDGKIITVEDRDVTDAILRDGAFEEGEAVGCAGWQ